MYFSSAGYILSTGANNFHQSCKTVDKSNEFSPITVLPESVSSLSRVKKIACGREHTMMLLFDGRLYGIGHNQHGQVFGKDVTTYKNFHLIPMFLDAGDKIIDVFCTQINTYFVTTYGNIYWSGWENTTPDKSYAKLDTGSINGRVDQFVTNSNAVHCFVISREKIYATGKI